MYVTLSQDDDVLFKCFSYKKNFFLPVLDKLIACLIKGKKSDIYTKLQYIIDVAN